MRKLVVLPHLGLGDMLLLRGLVAGLCDTWDRVAVVCCRKYLASATALFEDLAPRVSLVPVAEAHAISPAYGAPRPGRMRALEELGFRVLRLGYHTGTDAWRALDPSWPRALYRQAGVDPALITERFAVPRSRGAQARDMLRRALAVAAGSRIVLVHDDAARPLALPPLAADCVALHVDDPRIRSDNIFDYHDLLAAASHMHCIESCFALLVDLAGLATPMTIHLYAKDPHARLPYQRPTTVVAATLRQRPAGAAPR